MIKEHFITNYPFDVIKLQIHYKFLIIQIKSFYKIPKYYWTYILKYLYNIYPKSIKLKHYNPYYKLIILKYLL